MFTVQPGCDVGTIETFQDFKLTVSRVSGAPFARTEDVDDEMIIPPQIHDIMGSPCLREPHYRPNQFPPPEWLKDAN